MSADSQHRSKSQSRGSGSLLTVSPQQVTDPSILDSVAGFISDVVPNAYNIPGESKDQILWAHFEQLDSDDNLQNVESENILPKPLLLVLGYANGIQVWSVPANGEAMEIFSWKHGVVRILKILPTPFRVGRNGTDTYASKRPLIALCDNNTPTPHFCSLSFLSLKTSEQVKVIKFKNPILDVQANRNAIVVLFTERIAVFDAFTLEDRLTVTTCYVSPGIYVNPIALGTRWMAYAENKLLTQKRSSGGNEGEGVQSYRATVLHAAKSLGRGLRELGETVASSLTGTVPYKPGTNIGHQSVGEVMQQGIVTVLDIENLSTITSEKSPDVDPIVCHFTAHKEAVVCMAFDPSGLLLLTADSGGHDFHIFRIHPHPGGPSLATVHHLYVLHRGDTTARVQNMCFSPDSRWVAVSTLRGTTHVFPITSYGGSVGVRTHATPHVVNKMSRFHRSAGLTAEGRSNSPVSLFEAPVNSNLPYHNPRLPPYPHPTILSPLAQIRQPLFAQNSTNNQQRTHSGRPRLSSSSEDNTQDIKVSACFAPARAWIDNIIPTRDNVHKPPSKPVEALFIMSCHGSLIQYDLDPYPQASVPREKVCDDTPIELAVRARAQWVLQRQPNGKDVNLPLPIEALNQIQRDFKSAKNSKPDHNDDKWLSQVEIVTHAGPHRRLWMGPQFTFKTYNNSSGTVASILESKPLDVGKSKPVNMPVSSTYPVLIEAGSVSSCEPSPKLLDTCQKNFDEIGGAGELQLKEDLADAMLESPGIRETGGGRCVIVSIKHHTTTVAKVVNPLGTVITVHSDEDIELEPVEEIIHENCDEALFRPVVASKAIIFAEPTNVQTKVSYSSLHMSKTPLQKQTNKKIPQKIYKIHDKKLEKDVSIEKFDAGKRDSLSEVDSGIEKERSESPLFYDTVTEKKSPKPSQKTESLNKISNRTNYSKTKSIICDISDTLADMQFIPLIEAKKPTYNIITPPPLEKLDFPIHPQVLDDGLISLKTPTEKDDKCPQKNDEETSKLIKKDRKLKNDRYQGLEQKDIVSSSEENVSEEKAIQKKPRKPKTKLGVRIANINKENTEEQKNDVSVNFHVTLPKKSWSSVAASKPISHEPLSELSDIEHIPESSTNKSFSSMLKQQNIFESESAQNLNLICSDILEPEKLYSVTKTTENVNLLKLDKSSDEEKVESSQTETTESDDSSKIPTEFIAMDTEEDACQPEVLKSNACKSNKKKSKKKRR